MHDRTTFVRFRTEGVRVHDGPLWVVFVDDPEGFTRPTPPRVAFALGRKVGSAVVRNRLRRRLRAIVAEMAGRPDPLLRSGAYLIGARPDATERSYRELEAHVERALHRIDERVARR